MAESVTDDECGRSERWVYNSANAASSCESTECSMDNPVDKVRDNSHSPNAYEECSIYSVTNTPPPFLSPLFPLGHLLRRVPPLCLPVRASGPLASVRPGHGQQLRRPRELAGPTPSRAAVNGLGHGRRRGGRRRKRSWSEYVGGGRWKGSGRRGADYREWSEGSSHVWQRCVNEHGIRTSTMLVYSDTLATHAPPSPPPQVGSASARRGWRAWRRWRRPTCATMHCFGSSRPRQRPRQCRRPRQGPP